jgi:glyoxylase-like metal-dependent hydrolase (beta-lactamase superfamily II)
MTPALRFWVKIAALLSTALALAACSSENPWPLANEQYRLVPAASRIGVRAALIKTGSHSSREGLTMAGGSLFESMQLNYIAVLIRHPSGDLLFDAGLGRQIDQQYQNNMPLWAKPFLGYSNSKPAITQLQNNGIQGISQIILSHVHWDHASGLSDFPDAQVSIPADEIEFIKVAGPPAVLPSQFAHAGLKLKALQFQDKPYGAFPRSLDWFGDDSVVLVPLFGHTPGSVGLVLQTESGQRFLFVGDAIWNAKALQSGASKPWFVRGFTDEHAGETLRAIQRIRELQAANPGLVVVPAHDARIHDTIGYFPEKWLP